MARTALLNKTAAKMLDGSRIRNAEFTRVTPAGILEYVRVDCGTVVEFTKEDLNAVDYTVPVAAPYQQNGMEFRGYIIVDGMPVEFYGSENAFIKLNGME